MEPQHVPAQDLFAETFHFQQRELLGLDKRMTAAAPQLRTASRSTARSRSHSPLIACRSHLPGQRVIPTRPKPAPAATAAIWSGSVRDVFFISQIQLAATARLRSGEGPQSGPARRKARSGEIDAQRRGRLRSHPLPALGAGRGWG